MSSETDDDSKSVLCSVYEMRQQSRSQDYVQAVRSCCSSVMPHERGARTQDAIVLASAINLCLLGTSKNTVLQRCWWRGLKIPISLPLISVQSRPKSRLSHDIEWFTTKTQRT